MGKTELAQVALAEVPPVWAPASRLLVAP